LYAQDRSLFNNFVKRKNTVSSKASETRKSILQYGKPSLSADFQPAALQPLSPLDQSLPSAPPLSASSSSATAANTGGGLGNISGNVNYRGTAPLVVDSDVSISGIETLNGARVLIGNFDIDKDRLGIDGATSGSENGVSWNYDQSRGVLTLDSTAGVSSGIYQGLLRRVTYVNTDANNPGPARNIQFSLGNLLANPDNGHFYQFVTGGDNVGVAWTDARDRAGGTNYLGRTGYLATITSEIEQQFIQSRVSGNGWIGASDIVDFQASGNRGSWRWVTGPEGTEDGGRGRQFWQGLGGAAGSGPVGGNYNNWDLARGEPNNTTNDQQPGGENYAHIVGDPGAGNIGKWNDLPNQRADNYAGILAYQPRGYIVEYGGLSSDSSPAITASVTLNFTGAVGGSGTPAVGTTTNAPSLNNVTDSNNFNRPELLWRNYSATSPSRGQNIVWTLDYNPANGANAFTINGDPRLSKLIQEVGDTGWEIEGLFDVDGNQISDILWRNYRTGENSLWFMTFDNNTGLQIDGSRSQALTTVSDVNWEIDGFTNFDSAGGPEILWHNYRTGETRIWAYDFNAGVAGPGALTANQSRSQAVGPSVGPDWYIEGWADFNNDQVADFLWRNYRTGENVIWSLNGDPTGNSPYLTPGASRVLPQVEDSLWEIAEVLDFDSDGTADIFWRNYRTGENVLWGMARGASIDPTKSGAITQVPDAQWRLDGSADFTGDGVTDLVWRNYRTGENIIWGMRIEGGRYATNAGFNLTQVPDLGWEVEGPSPQRDIA
jgi:hypothetical protein